MVVLCGGGAVVLVFCGVMCGSVVRCGCGVGCDVVWKCHGGGVVVWVMW